MDEFHRNLGTSCWSASGCGQPAETGAACTFQAVNALHEVALQQAEFDNITTAKQT